MRALPDPAIDLACCRLPLTDLGNAERWRARFGQDFRFCDVLGWFAWDGRRWALLSEEKDKLPARVMQSVFLTVRAIRNEAVLVAASGWGEDEDGKPKRNKSKLPHGYFDEPGREEWFDDLDMMDFVVKSTQTSFVLWSDKIKGWATTSEGLGKLNAVANIAKSFAEIAIEQSALDVDRMAINVLNGTLRIQRRKVKRPSEEVAAGKSEWKVDGWEIKRHAHDRADLITKLAPVKYLPRATSPEYDGFIARVQPDEAMRRFIHQWGGLSLTGDVSEQKLAFFYGGGSNGKGTWVELMAHLAGDYAGNLPIESFLDSGGKRRGDQATPDIASLPGVRFLRVSEPEKGATLNEGLIKEVTGEDPITARLLNKGFFTFQPDFKMTISGNSKPNIKDTSDGIWRRMQLVPWDVKIPKEERDRGLRKRMMHDEASGVLNRLMEGLIDWMANGLIEPDAVRMATQAYRDQSDELGRFLSDLCETSADTLHVRVGAKELHDLYTAWCEHAGGTFWKIKGFKNGMIDKGFASIPSNGMKWLGVQPRAGVTLEGVKAGEWPAVADDPARDDRPNRPSGPLNAMPGDDLDDDDEVPL